MSPGQTGHITGQMGRVPGTDGTHTRGCPAKILYVYCFCSFPNKNAIAMEIVVFCYRGSILLSVPIRCHFPQENSIQITIAVANYYHCSDLLPLVFSGAAGGFLGI